MSSTLAGEYHSSDGETLMEGTLGELTERDQRAIDLYVGAGKSIREVAAVDGRSQERIWRVLKNAGVVRHRGEVRPGPAPDPNAVNKRRTVSYRPDDETRQWIESHAERHGLSMSAAIDSLLHSYRDLLAATRKSAQNSRD